MDAVMGLTVVTALAVLPLVLLNLSDRRRERALDLRARLDSVVRRAHGGESLLTVEVTPPGLWRRGRVVLAAPAGWECLVEKPWRSLIARVPADYELVVPVARRAAAAPPVELPRAA